MKDSKKKTSLSQPIPNRTTQQLKVKKKPNSNNGDSIYKIELSQGNLIYLKSNREKMELGKSRLID